MASPHTLLFNSTLTAPAKPLPNGDTPPGARIFRATPAPKVAYCIKCDLERRGPCTVSLLLDPLKAAYGEAAYTCIRTPPQNWKEVR